MSLTPNEARTIVYDYFIANWSPPAPAVDNYCFDDEAFDPEGIQEWLKISMRHTGGGQHTLGPIGSREFRRRAVLQFKIYTTVDRGLLRLDALAKTARDLFEGKTISQVMFHDSLYREDIGAEEPKGTWVEGLVQVDFTYDETK